MDAGALDCGGQRLGRQQLQCVRGDGARHYALERVARPRAALPRAEAFRSATLVDAYTINAAVALLSRSALRVVWSRASAGDFIVLDRDIFAIDPFDIHSTKVLSTYLDGRLVYRDPSAGF